MICFFVSLRMTFGQLVMMRVRLRMGVPCTFDRSPTMHWSKTTHSTPGSAITDFTHCCFQLDADAGCSNAKHRWLCTCLEAHCIE